MLGLGEMNKVFVTLFLGLLFCSLAIAQSSLPKCKGINTFLWSDCFGIEAMSEGKTYVGEYEMGVPNGQGTITLPDGEQYVGQWYMGSRHGQGTHTFANGNQYIGEFSENQYHGQGTFTRPDGLKYVGQYKDSKRHGLGTMLFPDGAKLLDNGKTIHSTDKGLSHTQMERLIKVFGRPMN